jgi:excisionase family DNA binding protein
MHGVNDEPIDLEAVRKGDALLDEAERLREESGREKRQLSPEDLEGIYMGEQQQTYTVSDAAKLTGYHPESIRRHIRDDKLKAAQTGKGNYRISRPELARWWREELGGGELFDVRFIIRGPDLDEDWTAETPESCRELMEKAPRPFKVFQVFGDQGEKLLFEFEHFDHPYHQGSKNG